MPSPVPIKIHPVLFWQNMLVYTYSQRIRMLRYELKSSFKCLNTGKGGLLDHAEDFVSLRMNEWLGLTLGIIKPLEKFVSPERKHTYIHKIHICVHMDTYICTYMYIQTPLKFALILFKASKNNLANNSSIQTFLYPKTNLLGKATQPYS